MMLQQQLYINSIITVLYNGLGFSGNSVYKYSTDTDATIHTQLHS